MPKLKNQPPRYCKLRVGKKQYAVVYSHGRTIHLGAYGSPESKVAYTRFVAENKADQPFYRPKDDSGVYVKELTAAFLDHAKATLHRTDYEHYRTILFGFLLKFYGDDIPAESFTPKCLKLIRTEMIQSNRFCRNTINKYVSRIVTIFGWGVENELVPETIWRALGAVKFLKKGHPGTFDHEERMYVPDYVVKRTLPFMSPTVAAMVQIQRLAGLRPSEVCRMTVGSIRKTAELWYYDLEHHKTEQHIGKKTVPLGKPEQELLAPYLEGKKPTDTVFSPRTAVKELNAIKRANRQTKITPSQAARDKECASKPSRYKEIYSHRSYLQAIKHAIAKGNKVLPAGEKIPHWFPYQLRHAAATDTENTDGLDKAQALLGHKTANMTKRYAKAQLAIAESLARNRRNPFEPQGE